MESFCKTSRVFTTAKISSCCFCFTYNYSSTFWMFGSSYNEIEICIVLSNNFLQYSIVSEMPFNASFKSFYLYSHISGGMAGCNLICSSNIFVLYSNFICTSVFFNSLIMTGSFTTFSVGGSSSCTFTSKTMLQLSSMDFSNCSCCSCTFTSKTMLHLSS